MSRIICETMEPDSRSELICAPHSRQEVELVNIRLMSAVVLAVFLLGACSSMGPVSGVFQPAGALLASGMKSYNDGDYQSAFISLRKAQEAGLGDRRDQVLAHKYLAFIHCAFGREQQCRDEFKNALRIDPAFELTAAEAGHPSWGEIFLSEKTRFAIQSGVGKSISRNDRQSGS